MNKEKLFETIYDSIPFDIFVKDPQTDFSYVYCNRNFKESQGAHSEVIGKTDFEIFNNDHDSVVIREHDLRVMSTNQSASYYENYIDEEGDVRSIISTKRPIEIEGYDHPLLLGTSIDTGKLPVGNREMAEAYIKLAFVDNVHHAINTPLNIIMGFSELMATTSDSMEREEYIRLIRQNGQLLRHIIDDMMYLSRRDIGISGKHEEDIFDLPSLCRELHSVLLVAAPKEVEFTFTCPCNEQSCYSSKTRISHILTNLLTNAFKFTEKGNIDFGYEDKGDELLFHVSDTGTGMDSKQVTRIFDSYAKLERDTDGIGLGLAICKKMVRSLGGKIWAESATGEGTTIFFTIKKGEKPEA